MKICRYLNLNSPEGHGRLGIIEDGHVLDPSWALAVEYERMGYPNPFERAEYNLPSSLFKLLNLVNNPMERLKEGRGMVEFLDILEISKSKSGVRFRYDLNNSNIKLLSPIDHIPVYRDFYVHEKHVKKGFEKKRRASP